MSIELEFKLAVLRVEVAECHDIERLRGIVIEMAELMEVQKQVFAKIIAQNW